MGKFPVISISLKEVDAEDYLTARSMMIDVINREVGRRKYLLESDRLLEMDKKLFAGLLKSDMSDAELCWSLKELSDLLQKHYGKKAIILIDEYDVPLKKANEQGYYDEMNLLIRNMFGNALKTNDSLLVKYRQQNDHKTSVGKCFSNNPKRDRAAVRRRNGSEGNSKRINLSGNQGDFCDPDSGLDAGGSQKGHDGA